MDTNTEFLNIERKFHESMSVEDIMNACYALMTSFSDNFAALLFFSETQSYTKGVVTPCSHQFPLRRSDEMLGTVQFSFEQPCSVAEERLMAGFVKSLFQPIKNALLYQDALSLAYSDTLTKTYNRHFFTLSLDKEIQSLRTDTKALSMILIDIDKFKDINDRYGHDVGDKVLSQVARTLKNTLRKSDMLFRYGGEEFVVLVRNAAASDAAHVAEKVRYAIANQAIAIDGGLSIHCTVSAGVAQYQPAQPVDQFFKKADEALYLSKASGRNTVTVFNHLDIHELCSTQAITQ